MTFFDGKNILIQIRITRLKWSAYYFTNIWICGCDNKVFLFLRKLRNVVYYIFNVNKILTLKSFSNKM